MDFAPGTQVSSVVRLVRPLGHGGMGAVWVAEHLTLQTEVVVKFMSEALSADPVSLARFSREASAAAAVKSPHVVQMLDYGFMTDGTPFIVMERLEGEDMKQRLARDHAIPLVDLAVIVSQACKALGRAHASGIVHRDIKPDNIFLCRTDDDEPFVKLLDFGIAKSGDPNEFHMTQTGVMVGTPFYMSPEQALGSPPVDATTDLWSLGVVVYEAMTGARPFDGPTLGALTLAICNEGPPIPSALDAKIPPAIDAWVAQACARERKQRFPTAKAMNDAFVAAVRSSVGASAGPLAFQATALSEGNVRPIRSSSPPSAIHPEAQAKARALPHVPGLATTTTPIVSQAHPSDASATPFAPVLAPLTTPPSSRLGLYLAAGGLLLVLGVAAGVVVTQRDEGEAPMGVPAVAAAPGAAPESKAGEPKSEAKTADPPGAPPLPVESAPAVVTVSPAPKPALQASQPTASKPPPVSSSLSSSASTSRPLSHIASGAASSPSAPSGPVSCDPPYFFDSSHNKVFKKECL